MKVISKPEFGLTEKTVDKIRKVFSSFPEIEEVILYGSRAKGNFKAGSDIDLTLKGDNITHTILSMIDIMLDDLMLPYIIDTSLFGNIDNEDLLEHIRRVGKIFYKK